MLRPLVLILLLANLAFFSWSQGWLRVLGTGPSLQAEPFRVTQQIRPDALRIVPEAPAPALSPAPAPEAAAAAGGQ